MALGQQVSSLSGSLLNTSDHGRQDSELGESVNWARLELSQNNHSEHSWLLVGVHICIEGGLFMVGSFTEEYALLLPTDDSILSKLFCNTDPS